ncbi:MAG: cation transporter [Chloracidobacterium sp.]|nr:cation transporter [Chloracidobacterium sp.]
MTQKPDPAEVWAGKIALGITFVYMLAEAVGGWFTNSLALIADAGHMFTDVAAMSLTLFAFWFSARPATRKKTYGYYRMEILAAFVNGVALALIAVWVIFEAVGRFSSPPEIMGAQLLAIAAGGFVVNVIAAALLHSGHKHNLNLRGAFLHVIGDLLGSVAAVTAGALIIAFGWMWADAVGSILISLIIIVGAWRLILESVNVLLEGTPAHIDLSAVADSILGSDGVTGIHDLHVWTISSGIYALSVHISHDPSVAHSDLLAIVRDKLHESFGIDHLTIQMETADRETEAVYICETGTKCFEPSVRSKFANG